MSDSQKLTKEKHQLVNKCLNDEYVLVHLDSRKENVDLPQHLMNQPLVTLKLSKLFRGGLALEDDKIVTDLLFDRGYILCSIPLEAVWGVTNAGGDNFVWPQSTPVEVVGNQLKPASKETAKKKITIAEKKRAAKEHVSSGHLKRVK